jgi:hypothetical protein
MGLGRGGADLVALGLTGLRVPNARANRSARTPKRSLPKVP